MNKNILYSKITRFFKIANLYGEFISYSHSRNVSSKNLVPNSNGGLLTSIIDSELGEVEETIKFDPYNKINLVRYGIDEKVKYIDICKNESNVSVIIFIRILYKMSIKNVENHTKIVFKNLSWQE